MSWRNLLQYSVSESRIYQVTALVLRARDYGEGHRLFSLFTREHGKVLAVAKGIKKPRAKLASALQLLSLGEMQLATGRRFDVITQVHVIESYYGLRTSMDAFAYASYFAELFDESLEERQHQPALFDLLSDALERVARGDAPDLVARYVEISLVAMLGYQPHLLHCTQCLTPLARHDDEGRLQWPTWIGFSASQGGALCPNCQGNVPGAKRIAAGAVQVLHLLLVQGTDALENLSISARLRREVESVMRDYLEYRLEKRLRSVRFLREWDEDGAASEKPFSLATSGEG